MVLLQREENSPFSGAFRWDKDRGECEQAQLGTGKEHAAVRHCRKRYPVAGHGRLLRFPGAAGSSRLRLKEKALPTPGSLSSQMRSPRICRISRAMDRPSPEPWLVWALSAL